MKKLFSLIICMMLIISLAACGKEKPSGYNADVKTESLQKDYKFCALQWGDSWDTVQKSNAFKDIKTEITRNDGDVKCVTVKKLDFAGCKVDALLSFGRKDFADKGLSKVVIKYSDFDEEKILAKMTETYGQPQDYFLDKDGMANPIQNGWYTKETVEMSLTSAAKEKYADIAKNIEITRLDALLRQPLVIISFYDEENQITFSGVSAAVVREFNAQTQMK